MTVDELDPESLDLTELDPAAVDLNDVQGAINRATVILERRICPVEGTPVGHARADGQTCECHVCEGAREELERIHQEYRQLQQDHTWVQRRQQALNLLSELGEIGERVGYSFQRFQARARQDLESNGLTEYVDEEDIEDAYSGRE